MIRSRSSTSVGEELIFAKFGGNREFFINFENETYGFRDSVTDGQSSWMKLNTS